MMYAVMRGIMRLLVGTILFGKVRVEGLANVPRQGGVLVIGNHIATVDPPLTGALIKRLDVFYMAKAESFVRRSTRWMFHGYHAFPVMRGSADRRALRRAIAVLEQGHVLLVYPEGSRSPDATLRRPHAGVGFLVRHTGATVVPAAIWGSEHVLPKGANWPRRHLLQLRFGPAFTVPATDATGRKLTNQETADAMMWRVAEMLPAAYRGVFTSEASVRAAEPPGA